MYVALLVLMWVVEGRAEGGVARVLSINVTSLRPHWVALLALPWALLVTQEARVFAGDALVRAARREGMGGGAVATRT